MFDVVDTAFGYGREFLQKSFKVKKSSLHENRNVDIAFLLCGADMYITCGALIGPPETMTSLLADTYCGSPFLTKCTPTAFLSTISI